MLIEINDKKIEVTAGQSIIEVADQYGIHIPRFCYHKHLSIAANCRMCLVEVEKSAKPLPACATPISEGMKISTRSPKVLTAQKSVLEFLLMNHPLDCPICDQGGECELQDLSMGYGADFSRYEDQKRIIQDKNLGPLIQSDMTRCIHCTRCVRFGKEIAGTPELGGIGRGEHTEIGTFLEQNVNSEVSGNIIDLCPVGALTSKPFRFVARSWELKQNASIAPHDCVGSPIYLHTQHDSVLRVVPKEDPSLNACWISDRDRFSYQGLATDRLLEPKIKVAGTWETVSWDKAISYMQDSLNKIVLDSGPQSIGALLSANSTLEECYLLREYMQRLGSDNIDYRLRQIDFRRDTEDKNSLMPYLGLSIEDLQYQSTILLIGSNLRLEQPVLALQLRKMINNGGELLVINPIDFSLNMPLSYKSIVQAGDLQKELLKLLKAILILTNIPIPQNLLSLSLDPINHAMAKQLVKDSGSTLVLFGSFAVSHPQYAALVAITEQIRHLTRLKIGLLGEGSNSTGIHLMLAESSKNRSKSRGLNLAEMIHNDLKAYVLFNMELEDCVWAAQLLESFKKSHCIVAVTPFQNPLLEKVATILLPMTPFSETDGTRVNIEGRSQSFKAAVSPAGNSLAGWKILSLLNENEEDYPTIDPIFEKTQSLLPLEKFIDMHHISVDLSKPMGDIVRLAPVSPYASDALVRRAAALQKTADAPKLEMRLNAKLAAFLKLSGSHAEVRTESMVPEQRLRLPFVIDESVPDQCVIIPGGLAETIPLGLPYARIEIRA